MAQKAGAPRRDDRAPAVAVKAARPAIVARETEGDDTRPNSIAENDALACDAPRDVPVATIKAEPRTVALPLAETMPDA